MPRIKPNPILKKKLEIANEPATAIFSGFVSMAENGSVCLCDDLSGRSYIEFRDEDIVNFDQNDETGETELRVKPFSIITGVVSVRAPIRLGTQTVFRDNTPSPDAGTEKTCLEKRVDACKRDPMRRNEYCDSDAFKNLAGVFCEIFGDPPETLNVFK